MARSWLSIRVELVSGRGADFWPRPGRIFAASRSHTFEQLADAIELAFARWDFDPLDTIGVVPPEPMPYFGWGDLPDQYGRRWADDDGESPLPKQPTRPMASLPPLLPWWGPRRADH